jgi:hypothetical protein
MKQTIQDINFEVMSQLEGGRRSGSYRFSVAESTASYIGSDEGEAVSPIEELAKLSITPSTPPHLRRHAMYLYDSGENSYPDSPSESGGEETVETDHTPGLSPLIFNSASPRSSVSEVDRARLRRSVIVGSTSSPISGLATQRSLSNEFLAASYPDIELRKRANTGDSRLSKSSFEIRECTSTPQKKKSKVVSWLKRITSMDSRKTRHSFDGKV